MLSAEHVKKIESLLNKDRLTVDVASLFEFIKSSIEWREKSKFLFTENVSEILNLIRDLGGILDYLRKIYPI